MDLRAGEPVLATCTCYLDDGVTVCGRYDACTTVRVEAGGMVLVRKVCAACRERLDLPDHDVVFRPDRPLHGPL